MPSSTPFPSALDAAPGEPDPRGVPIPVNELSRLLALQSYEILDSAQEQRYDDITLLASRICDTPIALMTLVDEHRQWLKSRIGWTGTESAREDGFCAHAILCPDQVLTVSDARLDARFANVSFVTNAPGVRFYAGAPLVSGDGHALGTLCVMDTQPRELRPEQKESLLALSRQAMALLEERRTSAALHGAMLALTRSETLFREAYENAPIGIALVSIAGEWLRVNQSLCEILGYTAEELTRTTSQAITYPGDLEMDLRQEQRMLAREIRTYQMEKRYLHKAGHPVWAQLNVSLVWDGPRPLYFIAQVQDIGERKSVERAKAHFLTMVGHELRTPVTALRGALGILAAGAAGQLPPKAQALSALADRNADRLHRLVNDILDVESIESGAFTYRLGDVDLNQLVSQAAIDLTPYADQYRVRIDVRTELPRAFVHADADRMMQVLVNLISNAVEYSPPDGTVEILVSRTQQRIRVSVLDHGEGIPEALRPHIFEKFANGTWNGSHPRRGSGLGLNISRAIVEHHGGSLAFHTELGAGSTFYFELPVL